MSRFLRENGLSVACIGLFVLAIVGQTVSGLLEYNETQRDLGAPPASVGRYLATPHFLEATLENWESEFLQIFLYVVLTGMLFQKGSAESKPLNAPSEVDRDPRTTPHLDQAPWPVRRGGWVLSLYERSLSLAFLFLFLTCFGLHAVSGAGEYNRDLLEHGSSERVTALQYMRTSRFWFESFQNWQSEFLAVGSLVLLSIWLRQRGSPESKPVDAPHDETG